MTSRLFLALQVLAPAVVLAQPAPMAAPQPAARPLFSDAERARIVAFWNEPGRYAATAPETAVTEGIYVVRLTPAASQWFWNYNRSMKIGKTPPGQAVPPLDARGQRWEPWVAAKLARDRWEAQQAADRANAALKAAASTSALATPVASTSTAPAPPLPGLIPADLQAAVGNPPVFAAAVAPLRHIVTFPNMAPLSYVDNRKVPIRYGYYRFADGVASGGLALRDWNERDLNALFAQGRMTPFEQDVMKVVSKLEGGFDSINTYDTGFVSVGFIQFATLAEGAGSLGGVLRYEKRTRAADFGRDFRAFGLDVTDDGVLVAIDPSTGAEVRGPEANAAIIADKRLIATFQRAGRTPAFQLAQVEVAKERYYPGDRPVAVTIGGRELKGKVSDVMKSQAGIATLFDRLVNTGNIRLLDTELQKLMEEKNLTTFAAVAPFERELIKKVTWRHDFLIDKSLSQPR